MSKIGILYIVATPIGNLADLSQRALSTLCQVDLIVAEDTRRSGNLLRHFSIATPALSLHEYNELQRVTILLNRLQQGNSIALISDAGTPLISDPGYRLVSTAQQQGIRVVPIPGPCALIAALCAAGLSANNFIFAGFLSTKTGKRHKQLATFINETRTVIIYEAPHRIVDLVNDMMILLGPERYVVLARELTKTFETIHASCLASLTTWLDADKNRQKGEFVVLLRGVENISSCREVEAQRTLKLLLAELSPSRAVTLAAKITGEKKKKLYQWALQMSRQIV